MKNGNTNIAIRPAEVFPPGEFIREELEARGWSQEDLANIIKRPLQTVNMIVNGKKAITAETAAAIASAFGTSAELWMNIEASYRLSKVKSDPEISRLAEKFRRALTAQNVASHREVWRKLKQG